MDYWKPPGGCSCLKSSPVLEGGVSRVDNQAPVADMRS